MEAEKKKNNPANCSGSEQCLALVGYEALHDDEISFKKNDLIHVTSKTGSSGYWQGFVVTPSLPPGNAKPGFFPICFVTSHPHAVLSWFDSRSAASCPQFVENRAVCMDAFTLESGGSCPRGSVLTLTKPGPEKGFWLGSNTASGVKTEEQKQLSVLRCPLRNLTCNVVVAVHQFESGSPFHLSLQTNDVVVVRRRWSDGWWEGTVVSPEGPEKDRHGVFPSHFTVPNIPKGDAPLFCSECKTMLGDSAENKTACVRCSVNKDVLQHMLRALEDSKGKTENVDLFKYLSVRPKEATNKSYESSARIVNG